MQSPVDPVNSWKLTKIQRMPSSPLLSSSTQSLNGSMAAYAIREYIPFSFFLRWFSPFLFISLAFHVNLHSDESKKKTEIIFSLRASPSSAISSSRLHSSWQPATETRKRHTFSVRTIFYSNWVSSVDCVGLCACMRVRTGQTAVSFEPSLT